MTSTALPPPERMMAAFLSRDGRFDGVFVTAVRTTGIFCRPVCPARKPRPENVEFFGTTREALTAGYRPCRRCRPLEPVGGVPSWLADLVERVEAHPERRWTDADLRTQGLDPARVRRWFKAHHGLTFHDYARTRRIGRALRSLQEGSSVSRAAFDSGYDSLSGFATAFKHVAGRVPSDVDGLSLIHVQRLSTPLGPMVAVASDGGVVLLEFADRRMLETQLARVRARFPDSVFVAGPHPHLNALEVQLADYFGGRSLRFTVPLELRGTPFQEQVWRALRTIPPGETRSYAQVAASIGRPTAVRAVARANGDNRIAILVPCHRVIGVDGSLTGYGGGLWRKRRLLELELQPGLGLEA